MDDISSPKDFTGEAAETTATNKTASGHMLLVDSTTKNVQAGLKSGLVKDGMKFEAIGDGYVESARRRFLDSLY
jgi:hypothetical protein